MWQRSPGSLLASTDARQRPLRIFAKKKDIILIQSEHNISGFEPKTFELNLQDF